MNRIDTEVLVIGGGISGTSATWRLAEKGREVILLDKGRIGEEASGRAGGGVRQQYRDPAELPFSMKAVEMWEEMAQVLDEDLEYERGGNYRLLLSQDELEFGQMRLKREQDLGLEVFFWTPEETRAHLPFLAPDLPLYGATYCPSDGTANPLKVTKAIGRAAEAAGADIHAGEPAQSFTIADGKIKEVITNSAIYRPRKVILAAGPWSAELLLELGVMLHLLIRQNHILLTQAVPKIIPGFISYSTGYMRQAKDGNIHLGARILTGHGYDKSLDYRALMDVAREAPVIVPFLRELNIIRAFCGLITITPDAIPVIDLVPGIENLYLMTGFSGHGFCLGPYMGRVVADWVCQGECPQDLSAFSFARFK